MDHKQAIKTITKVKPDSKPNGGFVLQLQQFELVCLGKLKRKASQHTMNESNMRLSNFKRINSANGQKESLAILKNQPPRSNKGEKENLLFMKNQPAKVQEDYTSRRSELAPKSS
jgi:hypothetical protein